MLHTAHKFWEEFMTPFYFKSWFSWVFWCVKLWITSKFHVIASILLSTHKKFHVKFMFITCHHQVAIVQGNALRLVFRWYPVEISGELPARQIMAWCL